MALIAFGAWIAIGAWRELRAHHDHEHLDSKGTRTSLMLILGSSPMLEGIPAFFAAAKFGPGLIALMSLCFAVSTIATYVALCTLSGAALERLHLGPRVRRLGKMAQRSARRRLLERAGIIAPSARGSRRRAVCAPLAGANNVATKARCR